MPATSDTPAQMPAQPIQQAPTPQQNPQQPVYAQPQSQPQQAQQSQPTQSARQAQPSQFEIESRTFFNWLKEALKHPSQDKAMKKWYGWAITAFLTFVVALNVYLWANQGTDFVTDLLNQAGMGLGYYGYGYSTNLPVALLFGLWVIFFLLLYVNIAFALLGRKVLGDTKKFATFHDEYARRLMPWVMLELAVLVLTIVRLTALALPIQGIGLGMFMLWQPVVVAQGESKRTLDSHWGWILAMLVQMVASLIVSFIIIAIVAASLTAAFKGMMY